MATLRHAYFIDSCSGPHYQDVCGSSLRPTGVMWDEEKKCMLYYVTVANLDHEVDINSRKVENIFMAIVNKLLFGPKYIIYGEKEPSICT